jgi:hypothetical protein
MSMNYRELGRTGWKISEVSFGAWAIGGAWGSVDDKDSLAALNAALDAGVNFFDTADVYGDGRSERLLAKLKKERKEKGEKGRLLYRHQGRTAAARTNAGGLQPRKPEFVHRAQFAEPGNRDAGFAATPLPAHAGLLHARGL